jgi:VWFA-related protein
VRRSSPALAILCACTNAAPAWVQDPAKIDYAEEVRVHLVQLEVTVWPPASDPGRCLGLTREDFELKVDGKPRPIEAVDWLGSAEAIRTAAGTGDSGPARSPLSLVLFFDLWHLNLFFRNFMCPMTKPLAFEAARDMVREQFVAGDRLLLVTFAGWPRVHYGWIDDPTEALVALDRLEVDPSVVSARTDHVHDYAWAEGMESLLLALGRYSGTKELIYLGDDFRFAALDAYVREMAGRAQANGVTIHAVDLLTSCRSVPGPGLWTCPPVGGLGCTRWRVPDALAPMAYNTGGELFDTDSIENAVRRIREARACRYAISFFSDPRDRKAPPRAAVVLTRKGLTLRAPVSFQDPDRPPAERERQDALALLPRFGQGLIAEAGLWPLRPSEDKKKHWRALLVARLRHAPDEPWPDGLTEIVVEATALASSTNYGHFRKVLTGQELAELRDSNEGRLLVFPIDNVRPGEATIALMARGVAGRAEVAANVRSAYTVPRPPGPGEARPWYLTDRLARTGSNVTLLPSLDGIFAADREALVVGYGCRDAERLRGNMRGRVVAHASGANASVPIKWLDGAEPAAADGCGWLVGRIGPHLAPGLWRFDPPADAAGAGAGIDFRIVAAKP